MLLIMQVEQYQFSDERKSDNRKLCGFGEESIWKECENHLQS